MRKPSSSADPRIMLGLTVSTSIGLTPFAIHHMLNGYWAMAFSVGLLAVWLGGCAFYIWRNRTLERVGLFLVAASNVTVLWAVHRLGAMGIHWSYAMILGIFYLLPRRQAVVANLIATPASILLVAPHVTMPEWSRIIAGLTLVSVFSYVFSRSVEQQQEELSRLVTTDPLTNTRNRRALTEAMDEAIYALQRHGTPASLILLDLDHFKKINDDYGHDAGDQVLVTVAEQLRARVRMSDQVFRFGGEEFVILATQTSLDRAAQLAEDLRRILSEEISVPFTRITVSCGVAELAPKESPEAWLKRADVALYAAKNQGRNQVIVDGWESQRQDSLA